jgi:hypothetical protein
MVERRDLSLIDYSLPTKKTMPWYAVFFLLARTEMNSKAWATRRAMIQRSCGDGGGAVASEGVASGIAGDDRRCPAHSQTSLQLQ